MTGAGKDEPILLMAMVRNIRNDGLLIVECGLRFLKRNAVLFRVTDTFLLVPFEFKIRHVCIVCMIS